MIARAQWTAAGADENGCVLGEMMRTDRDIIPDKFEHILQHRHHAGLVAFAVHDQDVALSRWRHLAAPQAERLGDAQARAVEQRHDSGVARQDPCLAGFAGALVGVGQALGG